MAAAVAANSRWPTAVRPGGDRRHLADQRLEDGLGGEPALGQLAKRELAKFEHGDPGPLALMLG